VALGKVMLLDPTSGKPTRVKYATKDGKKVRIAVKSGTVIADAVVTKTSAQAG